MNKVILGLCATLVLLNAGGNIQNPKELTDISKIISEAEGTSLDKISIGGYGKMDYIKIKRERINLIFIGL